jgi:D-glucosaminate-6-phosphate ammonia-lyase
VDVIKKLGVKTIINAWGHGTGLGSSVLYEESIEAMSDMARIYVDLYDLSVKAGAHAAKLLGAPAAHITSGAASALVLAAAACMAGKDLVKLQQLPNTEGLKNEIIIQKAHVSVFSQNLRIAGAKLIEIGIEGAKVEPSTLESAISEKTAAVCYVTSEHAVSHTNSPLLSLEEMIEIAHSRHLPIIVDAAPESISCIRKLLELRVDLIAWSGGKFPNGPGSTGFLLGRKDLIEVAEMHSGLHPKAICQGVGRPSKVGKEDIAALITSLEISANDDYQGELKKKYEKRNSYIESQIRDITYIKTSRLLTEGARVPTLHINVNENTMGLTATDVIEAGEKGDPCIMLGRWNVKEGIVQVNVETLRDGEEIIIAKRLREIFLKNE